MNTPATPDGLARFDVVLDHALWEQLKREAERRNCDLGALLSRLLMQQVHQL